MKLAILALAALAAAAQSFAPASDKPLRISVDDVTYASAPQLYVVPGTGISYSMSCASGKCSLTINSTGSGDANQAANLVKAGPASGADAAPTYRALVAADLAAALPPLTTAGIGYFAPHAFVTSSTGATTSKRVYTMQIVVREPMSVSAVRFAINTASGTCGGTCGLIVGIYSKTGTLLSSSEVLTSGGAVDINALGVKSATFASPASLSADVYILAFATDSAVLKYDGTAGSVASSQLYAPVFGYAANAATGDGAGLSLPSAAGSISADSSHHPLVVLFP